MDKGTIIYIGGFELPDKNAAAHRVLNNGKVLRKLGYNVVFIDVDKNLFWNIKMKCYRRIVQGFECWSIPYPRSNKQWIEYLCNIDHFFEITKKYKDIKAVICYNYQSIAFIKIKKYCNKNNIKIIADCTEWYSTKGTNIMFKIIKGLDIFLRMRIIQKQLDGIIVISKYLRNYYRKYKNILYLPPLVDLKEEKWKQKFEHCNNDKLQLIYAGSPGKDKDKLNIIIESLSKIVDELNFVFKVVGITKEQYLIDYVKHKSIIDKLDYRVEFLGRLSHTECLSYVKTSDLSILIRENTRMTKSGFPTKFVESVSCGIPVISTKISDIEDYIIDGENGFFIDINNEKLASALNKILKISRNKIECMKKKCSESRVFHYENYIEQFRQFLDSI